MSEQFKKSLRGELTSSEGYQIKLQGKTTLRYFDQYGELLVDAQQGKGSAVTISRDSIPDTPWLSRTLVIERIERTAKFAGWDLTLS